jgi:hypothetical protein
MLGENFTVNSAAEIDETSAVTWLQQELTSPGTMAGVRNLNVRDFLLDSKRIVKRKTVTSTYFRLGRLLWSSRTPASPLISRHSALPSPEAWAEFDRLVRAWRERTIRGEFWCPP